MIRAVLNNTIYYANQKGIVQMEFTDNQIPNINEGDEISEKSMYCEKESIVGKKYKCYVVVFLGYKGSYNKKDFQREVKVNIDTNRKVKCFFQAENTKCKINGNTATISMNGLTAGHTFRLAVLSFQPNVHYLKTGEIAGIVIISIIIVLIIVYFLMIKIKSILKPNEKSTDI